MEVAGQGAPFGPDLVVAADELPDFVFHIEICEDYWAPQPPSTVGALAGATILCNLSASNITIGKADERKRGPRLHVRRRVEAGLLDDPVGDQSGRGGRDSAVAVRDDAGRIEDGREQVVQFGIRQRGA